MDIRYATQAGTPGRPNEDYVVCGPDWIAVFDGATKHPEVMDTGCVHDVRWLVRRLAAAVAARMPLADMPLGDLLADAIREVRKQHGDGCDLDNPDSPSTTVSLCRVNGTTLDYLALADSPIAVLVPRRGVDVYIDDALAHLPGGRPYPRDLVRRSRNQPGGFWVASTVPEAAYHSVRGSIELEPGSELTVLTDGASRFVEEYGRSWGALFRVLSEGGPLGLISTVRDLEADRRPSHGKPHDDATAVHAVSLEAS